MSKNKNKNTSKYYVMPVWGCVEPQPLTGPFKTYDGMVKRAVKIHAEQGEEDAIFWMRTGGTSRPVVGTFTDDELDPDPGPDSELST
jgi:hypothetical protein